MCNILQYLCPSLIHNDAFVRSSTCLFQTHSEQRRSLFMTVISSNRVRTLKVEVSKRLSFSRETSFFPIITLLVYPNSPPARCATGSKETTDTARTSLHLLQAACDVPSNTTGGASHHAAYVEPADSKARCFPGSLLLCPLKPCVSSAITAVGYTTRCTERSCFTVVLAALQSVLVCCVSRV